MFQTGKALENKALIVPVPVIVCLPDLDIPLVDIIPWTAPQRCCELLGICQKTKRQLTCHKQLIFPVE